MESFRAEIQVEGRDNNVKSRASRGYRCVQLTSLYGSLLVPLAVVNSCPGQLSAGCLWLSCRTQQLLCPQYIMWAAAGLFLARTGACSRPLAALAVIGSKLARAVEAGIDGFPWPRREGSWDAIQGPPALGFLRYGRPGYLTGRVREDLQLLNKEKVQVFKMCSRFC